jgi:ribosomal protein S18 acetylase RimI-like enzyme
MKIIDYSVIFCTLKNKITFKEELSSHQDFLFSLYASSRETEMLLSSLNDKEQKRFLRSQFELRKTSYHNDYPNAYYLVIFKNKKPIGRIVINIDSSMSSIHIIDIALIKKEQNKGIGTALLNDIMNYAQKEKKSVGLSVASDNIRAFKLYQKLGFTPIKLENNYYQLKK